MAYNIGYAQRSNVCTRHNKQALGGRLRRIITDSEALYSAMAQIYTAALALISIELLKSDHSSFNAAQLEDRLLIMIIRFFDAEKLMDTISNKVYIPKHSKPKKTQNAGISR